MVVPKCVRRLRAPTGYDSSLGGQFDNHCALHAGSEQQRYAGAPLNCLKAAGCRSRLLAGIVSLRSNLEAALRGKAGPNDRCS